MTSTASPFVSVITRPGGKIHLALHSPHIAGSSLDVMPPLTLCGAHACAVVPESPGDVECRCCLHRAPQFMGLPGFIKGGRR